MELLSLFDADFDWPAKRLRLYRPGEGAAVAQEAGLVEVPAAGARAGLCFAAWWCVGTVWREIVDQAHHRPTHSNQPNPTTAPAPH
jgi:hypothetical protein